MVQLEKTGCMWSFKKMHKSSISLIVLRFLSAGVGPQQNETKDWNLGLDYNKYLQQVVEVAVLKFTMNWNLTTNFTGA